MATVGSRIAYEAVPHKVYPGATLPPYLPILCIATALIFRSTNSPLLTIV